MHNKCANKERARGSKTRSWRWKLRGNAAEQDSRRPLRHRDTGRHWCGAVASACGRNRRGGFSCVSRTATSTIKPKGLTGGAFPKWANAHFFIAPKSGVPMAWAHGRIQQEIYKIAERVTSSKGLEVVDVELRGGPRNGVLRIFIDCPEGITHMDCEEVSREIGPILDVEDLMPGPYRLEVSSPGLDRKLMKQSDYERFAGKKARIKLRHPMEGRKQFTGRLRGCIEGAVTVESAGNLMQFRLEDIQQARLVVEL